MNKLLKFITGIQKTNTNIFNDMQNISPNTIPEELSGIYYLEGSSFNDYFGTMNGAKYNPKTNTLELQVSKKNTFLFDGCKGFTSLFFSKLFDIRYDITFNEDFSHGILRTKIFKYLKLPKFIFYGTFEINFRILVKFTILVGLLQRENNE